MKRLALVTGGLRRLGAAISARLATAGYELALHGNSDAEPDPALARVLSDSDTSWREFVADFVDPAAAARLFAAVTDHFGRAPDLLVNAASLFGDDHLETVEPDALRDHYAVGCIAPTMLTRLLAAAPPNAGEHRAIVNILDQRLANPHRDQLSYTLAKYGLDGLTRLTARTLAPAIQVNAVAPGLTLPTEDYAPGQLARLAEAMPLARLATPAEIAAAVLYLAEARSITGQVLTVDGGAHMVSYERDFMHLDG